MLPHTLSGLYYRYKKTTDENLREYLEKIKIVRVDDKGIGSVKGYYPLSDKSMSYMKEKLRGCSLTFDTAETGGQPIMQLEVIESITYLVKSSSRFFLKPDIGEVFDAIPYRWMWQNESDLVAICINDGYEELPDTDGEHFLMTADLLGAVSDEDWWWRNLTHEKRVEFVGADTDVTDKDMIINLYNKHAKPAEVVA